MRKALDAILWIVGFASAIAVIFVIAIFFRALYCNYPHSQMVWDALSKKEIAAIVITFFATVINLLYGYVNSSKSKRDERQKGILAAGSYYIHFNKYAESAADSDIIVRYASAPRSGIDKAVRINVNIISTTQKEPTPFKFMTAFDETLFLSTFCGVSKSNINPQGASRLHYTFDEQNFFEYNSSFSEYLLPVIDAMPLSYTNKEEIEINKRLLNENTVSLQLVVNSPIEYQTIWLGGYSNDNHLIFIRSKIRSQINEDLSVDIKFLQEYPYYFFDGKLHFFSYIENN